MRLLYFGAPRVLSERKIDSPRLLLVSPDDVKQFEAHVLRQQERLIAPTRFFTTIHVDIHSGELISLINRSNIQVERKRDEKRVIFLRDVTP